MKLKAVATTLGFSICLGAATPSLGAELYHGQILCSGSSSPWEGQEAWQIEDLQFRVLEKGISGKTRVAVEGVFLYQRCLKVSSNKVEFVPEYFQSPALPQTHRRVLVFSGRSDRRHFFTPITTREVLGDLGFQTHSFYGEIPLKELLREDLKNLLNEGEASTDFKIRIGHPQVSRPEKKFKPKLYNYGLSWGVLGLMPVRFFQNPQGDLGIEVPNVP